MTSNPVSRRLAAIVVADVVGYTRLMERDEAGTHSRLKEIRAQVIDPRIAAHGGRIIHTAGDGMLVEFGSATAALRSAIEIQREMGTRSLYLASDERIDFRVGINLCDIIIDGDDIAGEGVNVAARLETLAEPGGICISATVREHAHEVLGVGFVDIGEQQVKNIVRPIRVFRVTLGMSEKAPNVGAKSMSRTRSPQQRWIILGIVIVLAIGVGIWFAQQQVKPVIAPALTQTSVAVLPLVASSAEVADQQLADALTQDLTAALGRSRFARISSPGLSAAYKGKLVDARSVGRELNVRFLVEGEIRAESERDVVNLRLVDAGSGTQVWSDQNEIRRAATSEERKILVLRSARRLRNALYIEFRKDPNQSEAMKMVFRADSMDINSRESVLRARQLYDDALRLNPDLGPALIGRGYNSIIQLELDPGTDRDSLVDEALTYSARALVMSGDTQAWELRGAALGWQGRLEAAFEAEAHARQLDPSMDFSLRVWLLVMNGQADEALAVVARALTIDPRAIGNYQVQSCWANLQLGRYRQAIAACEKSRAFEDNWFSTHVLLLAAYAQLGNQPKVADEKATLARLAPGYSVARYKSLWRSDSSAYQAQTEEHIIAGLRKAGIPEQ
jgi:adenylate cyclase